MRRQVLGSLRLRAELGGELRQAVANSSLMQSGCLQRLACRVWGTLL